ncbi:sigma 54-interacting transcriptional regulator [Terrilactibacillus sp. S3-3]|nr:sigma 54-interacting transcriptional regulator [Terrilactibacillus sp. S3-3]
MAGTGHLITLSDQNGRIIYLKGDSPTIRRAEKMNFAAGMDWSERAAGTNAIGTSIITKSPIQIFSAEHFCHGCHPWSCSSAPISHPVTQEIIGTIDFTGIWAYAQPHTLGLAISIAQVIETKLAESDMENTCHLVETYFRSADKWKTDHVLVLNRDFFFVKSSEKLARFFKLSPAVKLSNHPDFQSLINDYIRTPHDSGSNLAANALMIQDFPVIEIEPIYFEKALAGYLIVLKDTGAERVTDASKEFAAETGPWAEVIGHSSSFTAAINKCRKAASSNVPIIVLGESGTGKEKIAQTIHQSSDRSRKPFLPVNCGAIPKELISSELFGYERGTFTGGMAGGKKGIFEEANGGTLFLDEIGEMPLDSQIHLLRVLQEKEVTRLGSSQPIPVNVRIIAATHKNLLALCKSGGFREDLFYRLNVVSVTIPPLRERKDDILLIANNFLKQLAEKI